MAWCSSSVFERKKKFFIFISRYLRSYWIPILSLYLIKEYPVSISGETFSRMCKMQILLLSAITCFSDWRNSKQDFIFNTFYVRVTVQHLGLWPLACWDCGFESHPGHGYLSVVSVVCCQVEVSATDWSFVQRSPTECGALLCVIKKPRKRGG